MSAHSSPSATERSMALICPPRRLIRESSFCFSFDLRTVGRKDEYLEQIVTRLSLEPDVTSISWHVISMIDSEEAEVTNDVGAHS